MVDVDMVFVGAVGVVGSGGIDGYIPNGTCGTQHERTSLGGC